MNDAEVFTDDVPQTPINDRSGSLDGLDSIVNCPADKGLFHGPEDVRNAHAEKTGIPADVLRTMRGDVHRILHPAPASVSRA